jgi:hypothetical protein
MAFFWHRLHLGRSIPHFRLAPTQAAQDLRLDLVSVVFIIQKNTVSWGLLAELRRLEAVSAIKIKVLSMTLPKMA